MFPKLEEFYKKILNLKSKNIKSFIEEGFNRGSKLIIYNDKGEIQSTTIRYYLDLDDRRQYQIKYVTGIKNGEEKIIIRMKDIDILSDKLYHHYTYKINNLLK